MLHEGRSIADTLQYLREACSISRRQAYRYVDAAHNMKHPLPVRDIRVSFTVRISEILATRVRRYAALSGRTVSEITQRALQSVIRRHMGLG